MKLSSVAQRIRVMAHRLDFWAIRSPLEEQEIVLSRHPYELRAMPRRARRREIAMFEPTHSGVEHFVNALFEWRQRSEQFAVEGGTDSARDLVRVAFLSGRFRDVPLRAYGLGAMDDVEDILRQVARELMVEGAAWLLVFWRDTTADGGRSQLLPQFLVAQPSVVKTLRSGDHEVTLPRVIPGDDVERHLVSAEDALEFRWPLPAVNRRGCSPVDRVVDLHVRHDDLMGFALAITRAHAVSDDRSLRTERARWMSLAQVNEELKSNDLVVSSELYRLLLTGYPMTKYFDAFHVMSHFGRLAVVREYLVEGFNYFIRRYCDLLGVSEDPCYLTLSDYPSAAEIESIIQAYTAGEIEAEQAVKETQPRTWDWRQEDG